MASPISLLRQLARLYGVQTAYYDVSHRRRWASSEALLEVLRAMGAPVGGLRDVPFAFRERRQSLWQRICEPVVVVWEGKPAELELRLLAEEGQGSLTLHLELEGGEVQSQSLGAGSLLPGQAAEVEGQRYVSKRLPLPDNLPLGYHRLQLEVGKRSAQSLLLSAPLKAFAPAGKAGQRVWGVFLPLYALHTQKSWGGGDFSDLEDLVGWVSGLGGRVVATLPLLAAFLAEPLEPSPYAPASRLFWNEFYVDVLKAPERERCPAAQAILESEETRREVESLRSSSLVDYHRQMALKRRVLEELARCFFAEPSGRLSAFEHFLATHPAVKDYARFRAVGEGLRAPWPQWSEPLRSGTIRDGDYSREAEHYHLYVQWLAHEQLKNLSEKARGQGLGLYLDLPLGVHLYSYDVWREREAFVLDVSGGAPPDMVFTQGQDWGFPPLHPERIREQGYRYLIAYLRHHLQQAGLLRIDHVMGLHRLFWVPKKLGAPQGVYVRYPAEELYAILCLESQRHRAMIVGEDLGTVPSYVRPAMARHGIQRMYVVQYELPSEPGRPLRPVPSQSVASLNTHDMFPWAAFWQGRDIEERLSLGLLDGEGARKERQNLAAMKEALGLFLRQQGWLQGDTEDVRAVLQACFRYLAASPARVVLVNLEDLWLEVEPQNVPGTGQERPNWRRKARLSLEGFGSLPELFSILEEVDHWRSQRRR